jgi:hypothetical protein
MWNSPRTSGQARDGPKIRGRPAADEFSRGAVQKAVLSRTITHPMTLPPVAIGLVVLFAAAILPWKMPLILGGLVLGLFGLIHWGYKYILKGEKLTEDHVRKLREARAMQDISKIRQIEARLQDAGFAAGAKEAKELRSSYGQLLDHLSARLGTGTNLAAEQFRALADDVYAEGMDYLEQALNLYRALEAVDIRQLSKDLGKLETTHSKLGTDTSHSDRRDLERQIASHKERVELYQQKTEQLKELLVKSDELEKVLEETLLKVASMSSAQIRDQLKRGNAANELRLRVEAAHRAEERLTGRNREQEEVDEHLRRFARGRTAE